MIKICESGHHFKKTSDCTACPICEKEKKPKSGFLSKLAAPAKRALEREEITTLEKLSSFSEIEILALHGMGPGSIPKLREALAEVGLVFNKGNAKA